MIMIVVKHARKGAVNFGTHNGIFHCDEVVGIAILELAHMNISEKYVVRTRDTEILKNLYLVIDVGGGEYDHHMSNFNTRRPTGEKYASAGLVWRTFADEAIKNVMAEENVSMTRDELENLKTSYQNLDLQPTLKIIKKYPYPYFEDGMLLIYRLVIKNDFRTSDNQTVNELLGRLKHINENYEEITGVFKICLTLILSRT